MKGVIFNAVEDAVERAFGADGWDDTLGRAKVDGSYTSLGNYDDEELAAIVGALPDETGGTIPERLRWVGINCVPFLVEAKFREQGGVFASADDWNPKACVDGNLVTGQNPQSSKVCVDAFIELLA